MCVISSRVDDTVQRCCISKLLFRCIVGRKHNVISGCTDRFGEHQLLSWKNSRSHSRILLKIWIRNGFGVALTAKYSLYPLFHAKASLKLSHFRGCLFHRKDGTVSEILLQFPEVYRKSQMVFIHRYCSFPVHLHEHLQEYAADRFLFISATLARCSVRQQYVKKIIRKPLFVNTCMHALFELFQSLFTDICKEIFYPMFLSTRLLYCKIA